MAKIKSLLSNPKVRQIASYVGVFALGVASGIGGMLTKDKLAQ